MNSESMRQQILLKLAECILVSRVFLQKKKNLKPKFLQRQISNFRSQNFDEGQTELLKPVSYSLQKEIMNKLKDTSNSSKLYIHIFIDTDEDEYELLCIQQWEVQVWEMSQEGAEDNNWQNLLAMVLEEVLILASRVLPANCFEKNIAQIVQKFTYKLGIMQQSSDCYKNNLEQFPAFKKRQSFTRICSTLEIQIVCYYEMNLDSLKKLFVSTSGLVNVQRTPKKNKGKRYSLGNTMEMNEEEFIELEPENRRKHSMYEQYDYDFDMVFLSNSENSFEDSPKNSIKEVEVILGEEQFQVLDIGKDEKLMQENEKLLKKLEQKMINYLQL